MIYEFKGHLVEVYDSIHTMSILRFNRYNKYQMQNSEIGNTFEDYDARTLRLRQFLEKDMLKEAIQELENRRQTVFNAYNEFTPNGKSFAVLVKRIDNKEYTDFSPDSLDKCLEHLDKIGFSNAKSIESLKEVKKNSIRSYWLTFLACLRRT